MRENIGLYKAKRKDNGEWVEGLPIRSHIGFSSIIDTIQYAFGGYLPTHKIDPETLCECTGLKDKNGKLIFENDIVKILYTDWVSKSDNDNRTIEEYLDSLSKIAQVVWCGYGWKLLINNCINTINYGEHGFIKVIGNKFDSKELLGE